MEKVYFKTFGCSTNISETEVMQGLLAKAGFEITSSREDADVIVINVCSVKGPSVTHALKEVRAAKEDFPYKKIVVAGCISDDMLPEIRKLTGDASLISTHNIKEIVSVVEEALNDNPVELVGKGEDIKINLPKIRRNPVIGIIPVCSGCNFSCAYCSVAAVKGKLHSYPEKEIIKEVESCLEEGCKEIWVTSQDAAAYGTENDGKSRLPELLKEITGINRDFLVRVGMMNPNSLIPVIDSLIDIYTSKKIFKFLHLPVQSGNDEILAKMNRSYRVEDFKGIISRFREEFPFITISTDIICGFPTETKEQFQDSISLIKEIKPDVLNISRFWPRPGTTAALMPHLRGEETKERSTHLASLFDWISFEQNKKYRNWEGNILIDERGKNSTFVGRNLSYKPVVVEGNLKLGDIVKVKITDITKHDLRGELCQ